MAVSWWPCFVMMTSQTVRKTGRPRSRAQHDCTKATTCIPAVLLWVLSKGSWHSGGLPYSLPSWTQAHPSTEILPDQPPLYFSFWHFPPCVFSMGFFPSLPGEHKLQDSCLFCPFLDPQSLALSRHFMNISSVNGTPWLSFLILIIPLCCSGSGLRNSVSLASGISPGALCLLCGRKYVEEIDFSHVCPSSPQIIRPVRVFS